MINKTYTLVLVIILAFSIETYSREFLVSSASQIASVMITSLPGDTLTMTNGIWNNANIVFEGNGTLNNPILLRVQSREQVIISGNSNLKIGGNYLVVNGLIFENGYSRSEERRVGKE